VPDRSTLRLRPRQRERGVGRAGTYTRVMARTIATTHQVSLDELLDFVRPRRRMLLATMRSDGRPQM